MNEPDANTDAVTDSSADPLGAGVVTVASDRALESDEAGTAIVTAIKGAGHEVAVREHVDADHDKVQAIVSRLIDRDDVDVVVTGGATSVEPDDITLEAVDPLLDKELTAFDELFTSLAYQQVGSRVIAARTLAGVAEETPVFCLPGDDDAVRLALEEIILSEARYLVDLAREETDEADRNGDAAADENADDATVNGDAGEAESDAENASDADGTGDADGADGGA